MIIALTAGFFIGSLALMLALRAIYRSMYRHSAWIKTHLNFATNIEPYMIICIISLAGFLTGLITTGASNSKSFDSKCIEKGGEPVHISGRPVCLDPSVVIKIQ